ncbi:MAG: cupin domain-containing protein [Xanthomonadales bacterium]|nr:cupin domain-containing protein [Xanthomonadales bacterium]MBN8794234.1 cupin domain-containing protein [Stenotrophomonas nitritireducens]
MGRLPPAIEIDAAAGPFPLGMPPERFLRDYWQKRPLLIRNAFPGYVAPLEPEDLAGLACEEGVLARLIQHDRARDGWRVRHGPFAEDDFPGLPDHDWTLLVQDMDKWDADLRVLLDQFAFLPRWRIDDVMVSFAATGGSVGAHVDQYDVFLLQARGHRRWQIDASPNPPLDFRPDVELKLLQRFTPTHDWVLAPGDMLYLPPGVPHHGIAVDPCLTFSVGMRAPDAGELLADYADSLAAEAPDTLRYADPDITPVADPNEIDAAALGRVEAALRQLRMDDPDRLGDWFGGFITTYRSAVLPTAAEAAPSVEALERGLAAGGGLLRHPWSRMAWRRGADGHARLYAGGGMHLLDAGDARRLAAAERIDAGAYTALSEPGRAVLLALVGAGHYQLEPEDAE